MILKQINRKIMIIIVFIIVEILLLFLQILNINDNNSKRKQNSYEAKKPGDRKALKPAKAKKRGSQASN